MLADFSWEAHEENEMTLTASRRNLRNLAGCVFALALSVVVAPAAQNGPPGYINDNSDW